MGGGADDPSVDGPSPVPAAAFLQLVLLLGISCALVLHWIRNLRGPGDPPDDDGLTPVPAPSRPAMDPQPDSFFTWDSGGSSRDYSFVHTAVELPKYPDGTISDEERQMLLLYMQSGHPELILASNPAADGPHSLLGPLPPPADPLCDQSSARGFLETIVEENSDDLGSPSDCDEASVGWGSWDESDDDRVTVVEMSTDQDEISSAGSRRLSECATDVDLMGHHPIPTGREFPEFLPNASMLDCVTDADMIHPSETKFAENLINSNKFDSMTATELINHVTPREDSVNLFDCVTDADMILQNPTSSEFAKNSIPNKYDSVNNTVMINRANQAEDSEIKSNVFHCSQEPTRKVVELPDATSVDDCAPEALSDAKFSAEQKTDNGVCVYKQGIMDYPLEVGLKSKIDSDFDSLWISANSVDSVPVQSVWNDDDGKHPPDSATVNDAICNINESSNNSLTLESSEDDLCLVPSDGQGGAEKLSFSDDFKDYFLPVDNCVPAFEASVEDIPASYSASEMSYFKVEPRKACEDSDANNGDVLDPREDALFAPREGDVLYGSSWLAKRPGNAGEARLPPRKAVHLDEQHQSLSDDELPQVSSSLSRWQHHTDLQHVQEATSPLTRWQHEPGVGSKGKQTESDEDTDDGLPPQLREIYSSFKMRDKKMGRIRIKEDKNNNFKKVGLWDSEARVTLPPFANHANDSHEYTQTQNNNSPIKEEELDDLELDMFSSKKTHKRSDSKSKQVNGSHESTQTQNNNKIKEEELDDLELDMFSTKKTHKRSDSKSKHANDSHESTQTQNNNPIKEEELDDLELDVFSSKKTHKRTDSMSTDIADALKSFNHLDEYSSNSDEDENSESENSYTVNTVNNFDLENEDRSGVSTPEAPSLPAVGKPEADNACSDSSDNCPLCSDPSFRHAQVGDILSGDRPVNADVQSLLLGTFPKMTRPREDTPSGESNGLESSSTPHTSSDSDEGLQKAKDVKKRLKRRTKDNASSELKHDDSGYVEDDEDDDEDSLEEEKRLEDAVAVLPSNANVKESSTKQRKSLTAAFYESRSLTDGSKQLPEVVTKTVEKHNPHEISTKELFESGCPTDLSNKEKSIIKPAEKTSMQKKLSEDSKLLTDSSNMKETIPKVFEELFGQCMQPKGPIAESKVLADSLEIKESRPKVFEELLVQSKQPNGPIAESKVLSDSPEIKEPRPKVFEELFGQSMQSKIPFVESKVLAYSQEIKEPKPNVFEELPGQSVQTKVPFAESRVIADSPKIKEPIPKTFEEFSEQLEKTALAEDVKDSVVKSTRWDIPENLSQFSAWLLDKELKKISTRDEMEKLIVDDIMNLREQTISKFLKNSAIDEKNETMLLEKSLNCEKIDAAKLCAGATEMIIPGTIIPDISGSGHVYQNKHLIKTDKQHIESCYNEKQNGIPSMSNGEETEKSKILSDSEQQLNLDPCQITEIDASPASEDENKQIESLDLHSKVSDEPETALNSSYALTDGADSHTSGVYYEEGVKEAKVICTTDPVTSSSEAPGEGSGILFPLEENALAVLPSVEDLKIEKGEDADSEDLLNDSGKVSEEGVYARGNDNETEIETPKKRFDEGVTTNIVEIEETNTVILFENTHTSKNDGDFSLKNLPDIVASNYDICETLSSEVSLPVPKQEAKVVESSKSVSPSTVATTYYDPPTPGNAVNLPIPHPECFADNASPQAGAARKEADAHVTAHGERVTRPVVNGTANTLLSGKDNVSEEGVISESKELKQTVTALVLSEDVQEERRLFVPPDLLDDFSEEEDNSLREEADEARRRETAAAEVHESSSLCKSKSATVLQEEDSQKVQKRTELIFSYSDTAHLYQSETVLQEDDSDKVPNTTDLTFNHSGTAHLYLSKSKSETVLQEDDSQKVPNRTDLTFNHSDTAHLYLAKSKSDTVLQEDDSQKVPNRTDLTFNHSDTAHLYLSKSKSETVLQEDDSQKVQKRTDLTFSHSDTAHLYLSKSTGGLSGDLSRTRDDLSIAAETEDLKSYERSQSVGRDGVFEAWSGQSKSTPDLSRCHEQSSASSAPLSALLSKSVSQRIQDYLGRSSREDSLTRSLPPGERTRHYRRICVSTETVVERAARFEGRSRRGGPESSAMRNGELANGRGAKPTARVRPTMVAARQNGVHKSEEELFELITGYGKASRVSHKPPLVPTTPQQSVKSFRLKGKIATARREFFERLSQQDLSRKQDKDSDHLMSQHADDSGGLRRFSEFRRSAREERARLAQSHPDLGALEAAVRTSRRRIDQLKQTKKPADESRGSGMPGSTLLLPYRRCTGEIAWESCARRLREAKGRPQLEIADLRAQAAGSAAVGGARDYPAASGSESGFSRARSMDFLLEDRAGAEPPENRLGARVKSEHELRVERSLQNLTLPDWYTQAKKPREGFILRRGSEGSAGESRKRWMGFSSSRTPSTTSLSTPPTQRGIVIPKRVTPSGDWRYAGSLVSSRESLPTPASLSPRDCSGTSFSYGLNASLSRWSSSRLSTSSAPLSSLSVHRSFRQPYLGWRAAAASSSGGPSPLSANTPVQGSRPESPRRGSQDHQYGYGLQQNQITSAATLRPDGPEDPTGSRISPLALYDNAPNVFFNSSTDVSDPHAPSEIRRDRYSYTQALYSGTAIVSPGTEYPPTAPLDCTPRDGRFSMSRSPQPPPRIWMESSFVGSKKDQAPQYPQARTIRIVPSDSARTAGDTSNSATGDTSVRAACAPQATMGEYVLRDFRRFGITL